MDPLYQQFYFIYFWKCLLVRLHDRLPHSNTCTLHFRLISGNVTIYCYTYHILMIMIDHFQFYWGELQRSTNLSDLNDQYIMNMHFLTSQWFNHHPYLAKCRWTNYYVLLIFCRREMFYNFIYILLLLLFLSGGECRRSYS